MASSFALGKPQSSSSESEMVMGFSEFPRIEGADEVAWEESGTLL